MTQNSVEKNGVLSPKRECEISKHINNRFFLLKHKICSLFLILFLLPICILTLFSCQKTTEFHQYSSDDNQFSKSYTKTINNTGFIFFKQLLDNNNSNQNTTLSPIATYISLSILYQGAPSATQKQIAQLFLWDSAFTENMNTVNKKIIYSLNHIKNLQSTLSNTIYCNNEKELNRRFHKIITDYYESTIISESNTPLLANNNFFFGDIGDYDKMRTENDFVDITTSFEFIGDIKEHFIPYIPDHTNLPIPTNKKMLQQKMEVKYHIDETYSMVTFPLKNRDFNLTIVQPNSSIEIDSFIHQLNHNKWQEIKQMISQEAFAHIVIPQLKSHSNIKICDYLDIPLLEDQSENSSSGFKDITLSSSLGIKESEKKHSSGSFTHSFTLLTNDNPTKIFFDKPLIYTIEENSTGTILFVGKIL